MVLMSNRVRNLADVSGGQTATSGSKLWLPVTPNDDLCAAINE